MEARGRDAPDEPDATLSFRGKAWFWLPVPLLVALDLWSKAAAFAYVAEHAPRARRVDFEFLSALSDRLGFALVDYTNTGTIWGLGQSLTIPLIVLRFVAVGALIWFAGRTPAGRRIQLLVIGLVLAGAIGNLYDNTFMPDRGVRDFLLFFYRGEGDVEHRFPAFNVADSCITVGAIGLAILLWREPAKPAKPSIRGQDEGARS